MQPATQPVYIHVYHIIIAYDYHLMHKSDKSKETYLKKLNVNKVSSITQSINVWTHKDRCPAVAYNNNYHSTLQSV